jgi:acetoin utilization deacetylase AcuC-like enzyme
VSRFRSTTHSPTEAATIGFKGPLISRVIPRTLAEISGTCLALSLALEFGLSSSVAGGTHHAFPGRGSGYTVLNDLAVAAHWAIADPAVPVERVLVVDLDVHQGDGTAAFSRLPPLRGKLLTLSLHGADNFPLRKEESTWDVPLPTGAGDEEYMAALKPALERAVEEGRPDAVLYDAGVDALGEDRLGKLSLTPGGLRERDRHVIGYVVGRGIPCACVVGGGYNRDLGRLAEMHSIVHYEAARVWRERKMYKRSSS